MLFVISESFLFGILFFIHYKTQFKPLWNKQLAKNSRFNLGWIHFIVPITVVNRVSMQMKSRECLLRNHPFLNAEYNFVSEME